MKNIKILSIILLAGIILMASCGQSGFTNPVEVASDAAGAQFLLSGISAGFYLGSNSEDVLSRTVNPGPGSGGAVASGDTPADTYAANGGTGNNSISIGEDTPLANFYENSSNRARFTMEPVTGGFKIVLRVFPLANFDVAYQQETYYVQSGDTGWSNYADAAFSEWGYEDIRVAFTDGSLGTQTILATTYSPSPVQYEHIAVEADVLSFKELYTGDAADLQPASDAGATYSAHSSTSIPGFITIESEEFYTEHTNASDEIEASSINFRSESSWFANTSYVTRFSENLSTGQYIYRSLGEQAGLWWTSAFLIERDSSVDALSGLREYISSEKSYRSGLSSIDSDTQPRNETRVNIVETAVGSGNFSGTLESLRNGSGDEYTVELTRDPVDGTTSLVTTLIGRVSGRSAGDTVNITLNHLNREDGLQFTIPGSSARFTGTYEQGVLIGTYSIGSRTIEVEIHSSGVAVDGEFFPNQELDG